MRDGWTETTLDGIAEYINGYPFKPSDLGELGLPVIRIKQLLDPNEPVDRTETDTPDRCLLRDGDIVFSWSGTLAVRVWNRGPAKLNQHLFRVVEKRGVYKGIIPLVLDHAIQELKEKSHGTTMKHITKQSLLPHKVLLPPLPEQRRIVDLISSVDSYIEALQRQLESSKRSRSALLHALLAANSETSQIRNLGEVARRSTSKNAEGLDLVFTVSALRGLIRQEDYFTKRVASKNLTNYYVVQPGELVYNKSYSVDAPLGVVARNTGTHPGLVSPLYIVFHADENQISASFLGLALESNIYWQSLRVNLKEGGRAHGALNLKIQDFFDAKVVVPPLSEQDRVVDLITQFDLKAKALQNSLGQGIQLRHALLSELLGGQHEIPESYDKVLGPA